MTGLRSPCQKSRQVQHFVGFTFLLPGVEKPGTGPHPGSLDAADTSVCATRRGARTLARRLDTLVETFTINGLHSMLRKLSDIRLKPVPLCFNALCILIPCRT